MLRPWAKEQRKEWDDVVAKHAADGGLLQSWAWGEFNEALGNAVYNLSLGDKVFCQAIQQRAGRQWILSIPRGPVFAPGTTTADFAEFFAELTAFAKERGCFVVRFDPATLNAELAKAIVTAGIKKAWRERNPVHTLIIDTKPAEAELLGAMKSKWRYNINLAQKKGVTVRVSERREDAAAFARLMEQTSERQDFATYDADYFQKLVEALGPSHQAAFLFAEAQGQPIAALLLTTFGTTAYYLHGGSLYEQRALMAPHLLQWEAIKYAKSRGCLYDFWGVAAEPPANEQEKHWGGVTRFKRGFAPNQALTEYPGIYELPVQRGKYLLYRLRQALKR